MLKVHVIVKVKITKQLEDTNTEWQGIQSGDYLCETYSYIKSVNSQNHVHLLKCTEQNVNNQSLTQVSLLYVHVSCCKTAHWWSWPCDLHGWMS